jgi:uncharacterized protein (TIGR02246 family)
MEAEVQAALDAFVRAFAAGDADALAELFAPDAQLLLLYGAAVVGRLAIREVWAGAFARNDTSAWQTERQIVDVHGDRAYALTTYTETLVPRAGGPPELVAGRLVQFLRRDADGHWLVTLALNSHVRPQRPVYHRAVPSPRFTMVVLLVEDLRRSVAFYRRLGVEFPAGAEDRADVVVPIGDQHQLVLTTTFVRNDPDRQPPAGGSRIMLEFFVDGNDAVDAQFAELTGAGYHARREPFLTDFNAYMAIVDDPDGNGVLITAG